ncbi:phytanoyl-CoA dioxygenase family protein [Streptomyces sp. NPDC059970]|uniref:phytanoyl-CoA dioxygenase family protein n=1 Tax=Streptomyces sp. NPDC059970 TaxID=3347019 RepID=UPI003684913D
MHSVLSASGSPTAEPRDSRSKEAVITLTEAQLALLPTEKDVQFYEEHGWWTSPPILAEEDIEEASYGASRYYCGERDANLLLELGTDWKETHGDVLRQNDYVSLQIEELWRLVHDPLVAASAAKLARTPDVRLFHDQLIYKPPQVEPEQSSVGWHTDIAYWSTCSSRNLITAWIPFQPVTNDMGPMMVMDGSHRWEGNDRLEFFHEPDHARIERLIEGPGPAADPIPLVLDLGAVSFHHCRTIHGSGPNTSNRPRVALAVHMQDHSNRYEPTTGANGNKLSHLNDFLCRTDASGNPDYFDPDVCPMLWREERP